MYIMLQVVFYYFFLQFLYILFFKATFWMSGIVCMNFQSFKILLSFKAYDFTSIIKTKHRIHLSWGEMHIVDWGVLGFGF